MSNIHFKEKDITGSFIRCIFHFPVPDTNNKAGKKIRESLVRSKGPKGKLSWNTNQENTAIETGAVLEKEEIVQLSRPTLTDAEIIAEVQVCYDRLKIKHLADLETTLSLFGKEV